MKGGRLPHFFPSMELEFSLGLTLDLPSLVIASWLYLLYESSLLMQHDARTAIAQCCIILGFFH